MEKIRDDVAKIIEDVRKSGDAAVCKYTAKFDKINLKPAGFAVSRKEIGQAAGKISPKLARAIKKAAANIRFFHNQELKNCRKTWRSRRGGAVLGQNVAPVDKAGIYVPGGKYSYFSTMLMTAIPAKVAGVREIIAVTPPGNITTELLFAAKICGVTGIFRIGGPAAVAALAFGTRTVPKVDIIAGPGNAYVTEAKRQLFGTVGIDMLAGPSEVAILCDSGSVPAEYVRGDLLAQVEHDPQARGYVFCAENGFIERIRKSMPADLRSRVVFINKPLGRSIEMINELAPEHLEIMVSRPGSALAGIRNAGTVFLGRYSPVVLGDYFAGPSHVLPTGRTARFSSGVSVNTFLKTTGIVEYSREALLGNIENISLMSGAEGLEFHAESAEIRRKQL